MPALTAGTLCPCRSEYLLKDLEYAATLASILGDPSYEYPKEDLDWCWQQLLLCQFHDTLPGASYALGLVACTRP